MYSERDIQNHDKLSAEAERSSLRRRDEKLNADSEATSSCVKSANSSSSVCTDVELFSMKVNLKVFCTLCLCVILCDSSKASENLTFILKEIVILSSVVIIVCCASAMKIKESVEQMASDLFKKCEVPEELSVTFGSEAALDDDSVGRSRYERFYCVHINCMRENRSRRRRSREPSRLPLKKLSDVFTKRRKLRRLTREYISNNIPKSSKIHCYTRAHVLNDVHNLVPRPSAVLRTCSTKS